jgi:hypothetical protein
MMYKKKRASTTFSTAFENLVERLVFTSTSWMAAHKLMHQTGPQRSKTARPVR